MLYSIFCYHSEAAAGQWTKQQEEAILARRRRVTDRLAARGQLGPVARLMETTTATTVRGGPQPVVLDGPFAETKEQLLGFYIVECATLEEAIEAAREMVGESGALEIRPVRAFRPASGAQ